MAKNIIERGVIMTLNLGLSKYKGFQIFPHLQKPSSSKPFIIPGENSTIEMSFETNDAAEKYSFSMPDYRKFRAGLMHQLNSFSVSDLEVEYMSTCGSVSITGLNHEHAVNYLEMLAALEECDSFIALYCQAVNQISDIVKIQSFMAASDEIANSNKASGAVSESHADDKSDNTQLEELTKINDHLAATNADHSEFEERTVYIKQIVSLKSGYKLICTNKEDDSEYVIYAKENDVKKIPSWTQFVEKCCINTQHGNHTTATCKLTTKDQYLVLVSI